LRSENALSFLGFCLLFEVNADRVAAPTHPVTGESRSDAPTVVTPNRSEDRREIDWRGTAADGPAPANRDCDLREVWDVKERSEEHSPRSGPVSVCPAAP
jgi:hypothetical protein